MNKPTKQVGGKTYTLQGSGLWTRTGLLGKTYCIDIEGNEFEIKSLGGLIMWKDPQSNQWVGRKPGTKAQEESAYPIPRPTVTLLQNLLGGSPVDGLNPLERNLLVSKYLNNDLGAEFEVLRNTMSLERIDQVKRRLDGMVNDEAARLSESERQKQDTENLRKFYNNLPNIGHGITLPCGHVVQRTGAVMSWFIKTFRDKKVDTLKCQTCGKEFTREYLRDQLSKLDPL